MVHLSSAVEASTVGIAVIVTSVDLKHNFINILKDVPSVLS